MKQEQRIYLSPSLRVICIRELENVCDGFSAGGTAPDYNYRSDDSLIWDDSQ